MKATRTCIYIVVYLIIFNIALPYMIPSGLVYNYRLNFDVVKSRITNLDAVLEQIKITIKKEKLERYILLLGDSVAYGSPGPPHGSISYFLNENAIAEDKNIRVFNLSMPSMQMGDIYTILLKAKEYGISNDYIIVNILYSSFVKRSYGHPVATWLSEALYRLDNESYCRVEDNLQSEREITDPHNPNKKIIKKRTLVENLRNKLYTKINIFKYKDFLQHSFMQIYESVRGKKQSSQRVMAWHTKDWLKDYMKSEEIQWGLSDAPFTMNETNEDIFFLNKIITLQNSKHTLFFLAAMNKQLLPEETAKIGYQENIKSINAYFVNTQIEYIDFSNTVSVDFFSDHVHLTPTGYKYVSDELWKIIDKWGVE